MYEQEKQTQRQTETETAWHGLVYGVALLGNNVAWVRYIGHGWYYTELSVCFRVTAVRGTAVDLFQPPQAHVELSAVDHGIHMR